MTLTGDTPTGGTLTGGTLTGEILTGRYRVGQMIGGGGMGTVYAAQDERLAREVALKVMHPALLATPAARVRFEREAHTLSALTSPHTVTVFDVGTVEVGGLPGVGFIVMELLRGESLAQFLARGAVPATEAAEVLSAVADSLGEAHAQGIIHRDLKPDNILFARAHDGRHRVKVIDFGIARVSGRPKTVQGGILGTPHYMAPEQCADQGDAQVDARTDVYAMGIVLYEMLTRRRPFEAPQALAIIVKQLTAEPPPMAGLGSDPFLRAVEPVVLRALAKAPADRYPTMAALEDAFHDALGMVTQSVDFDPTEHLTVRFIPEIVAAGVPDAEDAATVAFRRPPPTDDALHAPTIVEPLPRVPTMPSAAALRSTPGPLPPPPTALPVRAPRRDLGLDLRTITLALLALGVLITGVAIGLAIGG